MKRSMLWAIAIFAFLIAAGLLADDLITTAQRDAARAEAADLKQKLEAQATEQTSCLKENISLISWKVNAQLMMMGAADYLTFCQEHIPASKFPKLRRFDFSAPNLGSMGELPPL